MEVAAVNTASASVIEAGVALHAARSQAALATVGGTAPVTRVCAIVPTHTRGMIVPSVPLWKMLRRAQLRAPTNVSLAAMTISSVMTRALPSVLTTARK